MATMTRAEAIAAQNRAKEQGPAAAQSPVPSVVDDDFPTSFYTSGKVEKGPADKEPIEDDFSAMHIAIKEKTGRYAGVKAIAKWEPQLRHIVALWISGKVEDTPGVVLQLPPIEPEKTLPERAPLAIASTPKSTTTQPENANMSTTTVTVTWGEEKFAPKAYGNITIGPFTVTMPVPEGEKVSDTIRKVHGMLAKVADDERKKKIAAYLLEHGEIDAKLGAARGGA